MDSGIYLDYDAKLQAAAGVVGCYVYLLAPVAPMAEALPAVRQSASGEPGRCALVGEPLGEYEFLTSFRFYK